MSATIKIFYVGDRCFRHVLNSHHDLVELRDEDNRTILTYSEDAKVFDQNGRLGYFDIDILEGRPRWIFFEMAAENCIALGPDLPTAKVEVSKRYISQLNSASAEQHAE